MTRFSVTRRNFLRSVVLGGFGALVAACSRSVGDGTVNAAATTTTPAPLAPLGTTATVPPPSPATTATTTAAPADVPTIEVISRAGWGASAPAAGFVEHEIQRLTVHHTARRLDANGDAPSAIRIHQRFHQLDRGWADIAYHFMIDAEGNVYEGRPIDAVGDTGTNYDPTGHFLVACEGNFDEQPVFEPQVESLGALLGWATREFGLGEDPVLVGHRDVATTTCPGDNLYTLVSDGTLQQQAVRHAAAPIGLTYLDDETSLSRVAAIEA